MIVQGSSLDCSWHIGRVIQGAVLSGRRAAVDLPVEEVGRLVHVDPGSVDRHLAKVLKIVILMTTPDFEIRDK
jgi:hypothetical protein